MNNISLINLSGIPDGFANTLLVFSFILILVPYYSGKDFGVLKVPDVSMGARRTLRIVGPILLFSVVFAFLPVFSPVKNAAAARAFASKGFEAMNLGQFIHAHAAFRKAADLAPTTQDWEIDRANWYYNAGLSAARVDKLSDAEFSYKEGLRLNPEDPQFHASLAYVLMEQRKWTESELHFKAALERGTKWPLWGGATREELELRLAAVRTNRPSP